MTTYIVKPGDTVLLMRMSAYCKARPNAPSSLCFEQEIVKIQ